ncbi:alpha/beta fold hydrolase [Maioricimonas sp. JC845]|uniref:alpha/beta fold hydrolase n=1 Tax=Maioricimonas sp. JC845 TaxID=3232138 RepID=UPI003459F65E
MSENAQKPAGDDASGESCPTPLSWEQVLEEFTQHCAPVEVATPGGTIAGATYGSGPPIYFLGGLSGDIGFFTLVSYLLRDEHRCVLLNYPDLPGGLRPQERLDRIVDGILAVADQLQDESLVLYGAMFGTVPAMELMRREPQRVRAALLQGAGLRYRLTAFERLVIRAGGFWPGPLRRVPGWFSMQVQNHRPWFPPFDASRWQFLIDHLGATPAKQAARRAGILPAVDFRDAAAKLSMPIQLVRTEGEGRLTTERQDELEQQLPNVRSEWMHTTGHLPYLTHPHRLVKLLRTFLDETASEPVATEKG